jgi:hypothetical protein
MSFQIPSKFVNLLTTDERLNSNDFSLKRKRDWRDDTNDDTDEEDYLNIYQTDNYYDINYYNSNHTNKYSKTDVLLSNFNIKPYSNPLLIPEVDKYTKIDRKLDYLHKFYQLNVDNSKVLNKNIKIVYRYSIKEFNSLNTKIDILNTKLNRIDTEIIDITHKLCLKIEKLGDEIKKLKLKK